ncbi:hypothetical protein HPP92_010860 [Vanilla planifolia]|uniref:Uncharacterized protein n=1 Tax=Vanilla planifolia TaxID=51239 RepID=A0A835R4J2_VANPL|nr:hypothetical protein HPP92_010860 [Vanilla planifolia]
MCNNVEGNEEMGQPLRSGGAKEAAVMAPAAGGGVEWEEVAAPPRNFAVVEPGVFRSGFPETKLLVFLQNLRLRSIVLNSGIFVDLRIRSQCLICTQDNGYDDDDDGDGRAGVVLSQEPFVNLPEETIHDSKRLFWVCIKQYHLLKVDSTNSFGFAL